MTSTRTINHRARSQFAAAMVMSLLACEPAYGQSRDEEALPTDKQVAILQAMTPEAVARLVTVKDDDLEVVATLTTEAAYRTNGRFKDRVRSDNLLRAFVDKKTGATTFQVYQEVTYAVEYRDFHTVSFSTADDPASSDLTIISHDVVSCSAGACVYKDVVGFDVDEAVLRGVAGQYRAGGSPYWRFRYHAQNGIDWNDRMMPAEAAGMLAAVDTYRRSHNLLSSNNVPRQPANTER